MLLDVRYTMDSASRLWIALAIDSILSSATVRMTFKKKRAGPVSSKILADRSTLPLYDA